MQKINLIKPELPVGGGVIKGMGEQFAPHEFSGASSMSIPFPITGCRGIEPDLGLNYSSGNANSAFGMGWDISLDFISRQTSKGVPTYDDDLDTFLWSGADYLVKKLQADGSPHTFTDGLYTVQRYIPRVEGSFARIDHYINESNRVDQFWKITGADNSVHIYGKSPEARIVDPADDQKIFKWLPEEVYDDKGNHRIYKYLKEDGFGLSATHRDTETNRYLSKCLYGNDKAITGGSLILTEAATGLDKITWHFELVFDYGQYDTSIHHTSPLDIAANDHWAVRPDPFSTYDAGFEIRTWRLCKQVLMFHRFGKLNGGKSVLTDLLTLYHTPKGNKTAAYFSFIASVQLTGSTLDKEGAYERKSMPSVDFSYTPFLPLEDNYSQHEFQLLSEETVWDYQFTDLYSEGIPGLLKADGKQVYYHTPAFSRENKPAYSLNMALAFPPDRFVGGAQTLADVSGNGKLDLVLANPAQSGFYEMKNDHSWATFQAFESFPTDFLDPRTIQADLTGDGLSDLVLVDENNIWYNSSERALGYRERKNTPQNDKHPIPESYLPSRKTYNGFANFLGAGTAQRVQIKNKSVLCWPGLGYGKFDEAVSLDNAPDFGDDFEISRLFLTDVDGSGVTDLAYVYPEYVAIYLNKSGNAFAEDPIKIMLPEKWTTIDRIQFADVKGNGTACLVFTKMLPESRVWYYDFNEVDTVDESISQKPHLLQSVANNLGAKTNIQYVSSTYYYLKDKAEGKPWITHLPFPVNVVASVCSIDEISGTKVYSAFEYSHGYYDGIEREFRGFGFVGRTDTESFENTVHQKNTADEAAYEQSPVEIKTWYHTGAFLEEAALLEQYRKEYWQDGQAFQIPETEMDFLNVDPTDFDRHGAYRALHGAVIRTEVYGRDETPWAEMPYSVSEACFKVIQLQEKKENKYDVFRMEQAENIAFNYERNPEDPMVSHSFVLQSNEYGQVEKACSVQYGRLQKSAIPDRSTAQQEKLWITYSDNRILNADTAAPYWLLGIPVENQGYEIKNLFPDDGHYFTLTEIKEKIAAALLDEAGHVLLDWSRHYYFDAAQQQEMSLGTYDIPLLNHRSEAIVFDKNKLENLDGRPSDYVALLGGDGSTTHGARGGYISFDDDDPDGKYFWNPGASQQYGKKDSFFLPTSFFDPFQYAYVKHGSSSTARVNAPQSSYTYDDYFLMVVAVEDPLKNRVRIDEIDYIHMSPVQMTDTNHNSSFVHTDPLGMVIASAVAGQQGDDTVAFDVKDFQNIVDPSKENILEEMLGEKSADYLQQAASFFYYDLESWMREDQYKTPVHSVSLNYTEYTRINNKAPERQKIQKSITYSDGFGRVLQSKAYCDVPQIVRSSETQVSTSWLTSGAVRYNNKGNPIKQYEPYFSSSYHYDNSKALRTVGPASTLFYDALGRSVLVKSPEGFFSKTLFGELTTESQSPVSGGYLNQQLYNTLGKKTYNRKGEPVAPAAYYFLPDPWSQLHYDANDCIEMAVDYTKADDKDVDQDAFDKALVFANTPQQTLLGSIGKVVESRQVNVMADQRNINVVSYDISGNSLTETDQRLLALDSSNIKTTYNINTALYTTSVDAGDAYVFADVTGNPIYTKDTRATEQFSTYDLLHRLLTVYVKGGDEDLENTVMWQLYGDSVDAVGNPLFANREKRNLIGEPVVTFDQSGVHLSPIYNVAGVPTASRQWVKEDYKNEVSWTGLKELLPAIAASLADVQDRAGLKNFQMAALPEALLGDQFVSNTVLNAAGQLLKAVDADGNEQLPFYDSLGRQTALTIIAGAAGIAAGATKTPGTTQIEYNAQGQQTKELTNNGVQTRHIYDPNNFRLREVISTKDGGNTILQHLVYHHDPVGNVCSVERLELSTVYFNNREVKPKADYKYSSLYQLISASGREQLGMWENVQTTQGKMSTAFLSKYVGQKNNGQALGNYTQNFLYDAGGNLISQKQQGGIGRTNQIAEYSNRLLQTQAGQEFIVCDYDANGNMTTLSGCAEVNWNYRNHMSSAIKIIRPEAPSDSEYYIYDASGMRVRKISEQLGANNSVIIHEVLYAAGIEIRRSGVKSSAEAAIAYSAIWHAVKLMEGRAVSCIWRYWIAGDLKGESSKSQLRYQLSDLLDSSNYELDELGDIITYEEYYPYGGTSIVMAPNATEVKNKHYQYSGKEKDATGLYYYGMRYYAPWLGRWTCTDPAGTINGLNIYAFVEGNPVSSVDVGGTTRKAKKRSRPKSKKVKELPINIESTIKSAVAHAHKSTPYGSGNIREDVKATSGESSSRVGLAKELGVEWDNVTDSLDRSIYRFRVAAISSVLKAGNCGERSALAFTYIANQIFLKNNTKTRAYMASEVDQDHQVVIIDTNFGNKKMLGEDQKISITKNRYVVDPWVGTSVQGPLIGATKFQIWEGYQYNSKVDPDKYFNDYKKTISNRLITNEMIVKNSQSSIHNKTLGSMHIGGLGSVRYVNGKFKSLNVFSGNESLETVREKYITQLHTSKLASRDSNDQNGIEPYKSSLVHSGTFKNKEFKITKKYKGAF